MNTKLIRTITGSFIDNARTFADDVIVKYKKDKDEPYVDVTWQELETLVFSFASGMIGLGMEAGDRLAILSFNRYATYEELIRSPEINSEISKGVDRVNQELARYETIKKFVILPREFTQEDGEITPTLKLKRKPICEKYRRLLDSMYDEA